MLKLVFLSGTALSVTPIAKPKNINVPKKLQRNAGARIIPVKEEPATLTVRPAATFPLQLHCSKLYTKT